MGRQQDLALERAGLLNYQTRGMSQQQIQQRYQDAGINVNEGWFSQTYANSPAGQGQQQPQPQQVQGPRPRIGATASMYAPNQQNRQQQSNQPAVRNSQVVVRGNGQIVNPDQGPYSARYRGLGYTPTFGQDPMEIANAYQQLQSTPEDQLPEWLASQKDQVKQAYDWFDFRNGGKPWTEWKFLDQADPGHDLLSSIQAPPKVDEYGQPEQIFANNSQALRGQANWTDVSPQERQAILANPSFDIAQYPSWQQQQILADPSFNWEGLPAWQRLYYSLSSNPAAMGAAQGLIMGAGNPGGALAGGALGYVAGKSGYDQTKEFWKQENKVAGAFGLLNWFAEQAEKGVGMGVQIAGILTGNTTIDPTQRNLNWDAGSVTFETLAPAYQAAVKGDGKLNWNDLLKVVPAVYIAERITDMVLNPEEYEGAEVILGRADPFELNSTFYDRINEARIRIDNGEDYRVVMTDFQNGVMAQMGDMVGQGIADPLNSFGAVTTKAGEVAAKIQGNEVAAAAFQQSGGLTEAARRYQNLINNPAEALKIDPNFKVTELGWLGRTVAGLTSDGKIKAGILNAQGDLLSNKKRINFADTLTSLTPESRARVGQDLLIRNLGGIMSSYFNGTDVKGFSSWWKAFSKGNMEVSAELSKTMANSPEFYTVLPAAKEYNIDGMINAWEISEPRRQDVTRLADILGENPMTLIDDLHKKGTASEDFARIQERIKQAGTPEAQALLTEIEAGRFTEASLAEAVKVFGDGTVPFHPGQWMAMTLDAIKTHYDEWAVEHFKLDEESKKTLFRMSSVLKSAQSILLLGANPGYMISNVLPTMVTRAMSGMWGYMTPKAIDTFMSRIGFDPADGFSPNRLNEGVGPSGLVEQATGKTAGDAIRNATRGKGALTNIQNVLDGIGRQMPFNKLSRILEGYEGKQSYLIGMKKFWGEAWIREKGFRKVPADLAAELTRTVGARATEILYSAIEAGMSHAELEAIVKGRDANVQSRTLINDAAKELNIPAGKAASMLEQAGILDALDAHLKGANNEGKIQAAFARARKTAQEAVDIQSSRDNIARAEHIANRLNIEGTKALTDIVLDVEGRGIEHWLQHYENMGAVADAADSITNADTRSKMWSSAYAEDMATYRRYSAQRGSTYQGILKAIGLDTSEAGRGWLATIADTDGTVDRAYTEMRNLRDNHFAEWNGDWANPRQKTERTRIEGQIEKIWKDATKREVDNLRKMGELLGQQYDELFGVEAGEAARQAWEQITDFRKEMVKRRDEFRKSIEGVGGVERQVKSKEFWSGTYKYMIVEMSRIKQEAIATLDRIANKRGGGDKTGSPAAQGPTPDMPPAGTGSPQTNATDQMEAFRQAAAERRRVEAERISAVWDIAETYSKLLPGNSSNFSRETFQDKAHLMATLKKEEYGGDPSITDWKDAAEKLTPDKVREILEARQQVKAETIQAEEAARQIRFTEEMEKAKARAEARKAPENLTILQAIRKRGGIDKQSWMNFDDKPEGYQPGVFSQTGKNRWALDQIARLLADDGYPINLDNPEDIGGINQTIDLIKRARAGEDIFPITHDFVIDAEVNRAQADYLANDTTGEIDLNVWEVDMADAIENADHSRMIDLFEQLPEDAGNQTRTTGETYNDYFSRAYDEVTARLQSDEQTIAIAENTVRAEQSVKAQDDSAQTAMTRQRFRESLTDVFGLEDDMANAVMDITDARANAYGNADEWYATRIADVVKAGGDVDLAQRARYLPEDKNLIAVHNLSQDKLLHAERLGGIAMPSLAILKKDLPFDNYGDITLLADKRMIDPANRQNVVANADIYTPRYPSVEYVINERSADKYFGDVFDDFIQQYPETRTSYRYHPNNVIETLKKDGSITDSPVAAFVFARENGIEITRGPEGLLAQIKEQYGDDYLQFSENLAQQFIKDRRFFKGFTNAGNRKYGAYDLDNIVRDMKSRMNEGESFNYGAGSVRSKVAKKFSSIEQVRQAQDSIISKPEFEPMRQSYNDRLTQLGIESEQYFTYDQGSGPSRAFDNFVEALRDGGSNYLSKLREYGFGNMAQEFTNQVVQYMADLRDAPTEYFEAKIKRAVGLNEFATAIIPSDARQQVRDVLDRSGIRYIEYDPEVEGSRQQATERAASEGNLLFQDTPSNPKGGVQFLDDGRAIIRAFGQADVSTVVHELGHIFRRDLQGADLRIIEAWTGVNNGEWTVKAEEQFARGFEKYLADGSAPTPKLARVFEQFKTWMAQIYRAITGSPIDIDVPPAVKEVFDNLLTGERQRTVDIHDQLLELGFDPKSFYLDSTGRISRRPELNIRVNTNESRTEASVVTDAFQGMLNRIKETRPDRPTISIDTDIPVPPAGTPIWQMTEKEYIAYLFSDQKVKADAAIERAQSELTLLQESTATWAEKERARLKEQLRKSEMMRSRNTLSYALYGDIRAQYMDAVKKALEAVQPVSPEIRAAYDIMGTELGGLSFKEADSLRTAGRRKTQLFQDADPRMPLGGYEQAAEWLPQSDVMDEGWTKEIQPLLNRMQEGAIRKLNEPTMDGAYRDMSPEGQRMMSQYLKGVKQDMASTKLAAQRWGAEQRDFTMLNYNKRYGVHQWLDVGFPYEFFYTSTMITTAMRALDTPSILSNYARGRMQQDRYENNLPERLRGKMRIEAPWLPDWMGDAVYIDPLATLFTPHNFLRPFEQMTKDQNMQQIEAERILQEWAADGTVPADQLQEAAQTKSGTVYERALAEAKIRREAEISNPLDFVASMFGPAWYLTTPYKLATGKGSEISELPITRTARAVDTVTQGTWAEPVGDILGLIAKPEEKAREALNLPQMGEYGDYYTDRNIANMVAEGLISPQEAQIAMIERQGDIFEQAQERTKMELAMRVPLAGTIYAGLNEGPVAGAQAFLPSLFGAGLLPEGELLYRGLKDEWNAAWKMKDAGDDQAITRFFEEHPEYEAYLAKGKEPEEKLRSYLIGAIWDGYMALGDTDRKQASAVMGDLFRGAFLNSETRSYDTLDVETLTTWAQMLNQMVPNVPATAPVIGTAPQIPFYPKETTEITDRFFQERKQLYPNYYMLEQGYYSLPKSDRARYLLKFPQLQAYRDWKDGYYMRYPELKPVFKGQVFKQVDTSGWPMGLETYVNDYAYTGRRLPNGAKKALEQVWIREGRPMGDMDTWLNSQVVPALLYQQGAPVIQ